MTKNQEILRIVGKFLLAVYYGRPFTKQEMKRMGDLCFLGLPVKHRMGKAEFDDLRSDDPLRSLSKNELDAAYLDALIERKKEEVER